LKLIQTFGKNPEKMNTIIRKAVKKDSEKIWELMKELAIFEKYFDTFAITCDIVRKNGFENNPPDFYCFVAEKGHNIAGILVYFYLPFTAQNRPAIYMKELYVDENYRGQKIGEKLMFALKEEAIKNNCAQIKWTVASWNKSGQKFYERLGAQKNNDWLNYEWNTENNKMQSIKIRKVTTNDINELQNIGKLTFTETFASENSAENMKRYLEDGFSSKKLKEELTDENAEFYFAELNQDVIGYLKVNTGQSQTEIKDKNALEIERIYVLKEFHGKKVGQFLYDKAIELAKEKNVDYVWLGVWEKNQRAIRFYEKNGFVIFDKHIFKLGNDAQTDILMKLTLS